MFLYLLELKNVKTPQAYQTHAIYEKFKNTLDHFMSEEFSHIFFNDHYRYRHIFLYLVTTAYRAAMKYGSFEKYTKLMQKIGKKDTLLNDSALLQKPFRFRNKVLFIQDRGAAMRVVGDGGRVPGRILCSLRSHCPRSVQL